MNGVMAMASQQMEIASMKMRKNPTTGIEKTKEKEKHCGTVLYNCNNSTPVERP
jgi:hypothetical protein